MEYLLTIPWFLYMFLRTKKSLHMLQQNLYDDGFRYLKWIKNNFIKIMLSFDLIPLVLIPVILFVSNNIITYILFSITYIVLFIINYKIMKNEKVKKPLVVTARVKRLLTTLLLVYVALIYFINIKLGFNYLLLILLAAYFQYIIILLVVKINIPVEKCVYLKYKTMAVRKLKSMTNLKVVGITGSYGKTSSKNILSEILNVKYNALPTPRNLNTPYGLMITINNHLDKFDEIFIAEMGAYKMGEIKQLCDFVHPKYGILTRIGTAHLESFGSQENIQKGKFELIESLPSDGVAVLNADDPLQVSYNLKNDVKVLWIGIDNDADFRASNIKVSNIGTTFDLTIKGNNNKYKFETKLLGYANVYNILAAIALGYEFGINIEQLKGAVKGVKPVEHRLEIRQNGDIFYIDDAYNSNPVGSKMALDVLGMMPGKKIIVTPGMIELGALQESANEKFGEFIADVCDEVILVGDKQTKPIQKGLKNKKYDSKHIHVLEDVMDAFTLVGKLKDKTTYVLLENDLPDIFK
ncbi:MAG TPA: UDP-N-acetylmuramoyl-tripeptide--D-alanyl-D-alanine ligase [Bacilli bacterium]|nr:UDP-N-acetylmuramoyl-tripeptide--D-alanyl-D-alanine ligase [Bacilli bacterium]